MRDLTHTICFALLASVAPAAAEGDCAFEGIPLHGRVKVVDSFPDFTIRYVDGFPDLKITFVESFPGLP